MKPQPKCYTSAILKVQYYYYKLTPRKEEVCSLFALFQLQMSSGRIFNVHDTIMLKSTLKLNVILTKLISSKCVQSSGPLDKSA